MCHASGDYQAQASARFMYAYFGQEKAKCAPFITGFLNLGC